MTKQTDSPSGASCLSKTVKTALTEKQFQKEPPLHDMRLIKPKAAVMATATMATTASSLLLGNLGSWFCLSAHPLPIHPQSLLLTLSTVCLYSLWVSKEKARHWALKTGNISVLRMIGRILTDCKMVPTGSFPCISTLTLPDHTKSCQ